MSEILKFDRKDFGKLLDNTLLAAYASTLDLTAFCNESRQLNTKTVAVNSCAVPICSRLLHGSSVDVDAAIAFPLGQTSLSTKLFEASDAIEAGAAEIDYVMNIGRFKDGDYSYIEKEMCAIVEMCRQANVISKVIFENCYLSPDEIKTACAIANQSYPTFIKTSTGFGKGGATVSDVALMRQCADNEIKVKAAGGVRSLDDAIAVIAAGADRIGTSAAGKILAEFEARCSNQFLEITRD